MSSMAGSPAVTEYTIDTNVLIDLQHRYPRDVFPSAWSSLEALIDEGRACICREVLEETKRGRDDLHKWSSTYPDFACPTTDEDITKAAEISGAYPDWVRNEKNAADPFVVAHAIETGRVIVTEERAAGPGVLNHKMKIPNVARAHGIETLTFLAFARAEKWRF